jgi:hypothetical protein
MESVDSNVKPGLAVRLLIFFAYAIAGCVLTWRALTYDTGMEPYPMLPIAMCAFLVAILYTLGVLALAGRSQVLTAS